MQAQVDIVWAEFRRWRLKASVSTDPDSKTAVMAFLPPHVGPRRGHRAQASAPLPDVLWGPTPMPWVKQYKYLGVHVTSDASFATHVAAKLVSGTAAARAQRSVTHNCHLPLRLRQLALTTAVFPAVAWAAEVWHRPAANHRRSLTRGR